MNSQNAEFYECRGHIYSYFENYDKAIADYTKSIELNSAKFQTYLYRGKDFFSNKEYNNALNDFKMALKIAKHEDIKLQVSKLIDELYIKII